MQTGLDKLKLAFSEALPLPADVNFDEVEYGKTRGWDSVAHMTLVSQIEGVFDLMLDTDEVVGLSSFLKAQELLGKHGVPLD
jgi:acyl carrier protein